MKLRAAILPHVICICGGESSVIMSSTHALVTFQTEKSTASSLQESRPSVSTLSTGCSWVRFTVSCYMYIYYIFLDKLFSEHYKYRSSCNNRETKLNVSIHTHMSLICSWTVTSCISVTTWTSQFMQFRIIIINFCFTEFYCRLLIILWWWYSQMLICLLLDVSCYVCTLLHVPCAITSIVQQIFRV